MMKKIMKIMPVVLVMCLVLTNVFATSGVSTEFPNATQKVDTVTNAASKVWGTVVTIVQILAFAALVFAGVRYMFASADQKADIKKGMGYLALGGILVFGAASVVKFLMKTATTLFPGQ